MLAVMESPAIVVGLILAAKARQTIAAREGLAKSTPAEESAEKSNFFIIISFKIIEQDSVTYAYSIETLSYRIRNYPYKRE